MRKIIKLNINCFREKKKKTLIPVKVRRMLKRSEKLFGYPLNFYLASSHTDEQISTYLLFFTLSRIGTMLVVNERCYLSRRICNGEQCGCYRWRWKDEITFCGRDSLYTCTFSIQFSNSTMGGVAELCVFQFFSFLVKRCDEEGAGRCES